MHLIRIQMATFEYESPDRTIYRRQRPALSLSIAHRYFMNFRFSHLNLAELHIFASKSDTAHARHGNLV